MDDIKTAIAAADLAVKEGRKPSTESLVELFRALRKSKVRHHDISFTSESIIDALNFFSDCTDSEAWYSNKIWTSAYSVWCCRGHRRWSEEVCCGQACFCRDFWIVCDQESSSDVGEVIINKNINELILFLICIATVSVEFVRTNLHRSIRMWWHQLSWWVL